MLMEITLIEKDKAHKDKLLIYIDGEYNFTISEEDYIRLSLHEKKEITMDEIKCIKKTVSFNSAKLDAVKYISYRLRTEKDVSSKLKKMNYGSDIVEKVLEDLKSLGYINDILYVQKYVFDRSKLKPRSKKMLKYELLSKGICETDIDQILMEWEVDDSVVIEGLIKRRFGKYDINDEIIKKKIYSFLNHRGFEYEQIKSVINKINEDK